jgi:hypothetical protein
MLVNDDEKVKELIKKVDKLGWIEKIKGQPYMHLADVEKTLSAILDEMWMTRINLWVKEKEETDKVNEAMKVMGMKMWTKEYITIDGKKFKVPRCTYCGKGMKPAEDKIAGRITGYLWNCDCPKFPKNIVVSIG